MSYKSSCLPICLLTVALALASCSLPTVYHQYKHVSANGWDRIDTVWFHIPPVKDDAILHESVELRTNGHYPFTDLCLIVEQTIHPAQPASEAAPYSTGEIKRSDTLYCSIADKLGRMKGKGVNLFQYQFHLTDLSISEGDSIDIAIYHHMRREVLTGIVDVGVKLIDN